MQLALSIYVPNAQNQQNPLPFVPSALMKLIQLTDLHLVPRTQELYGYFPHENLRHALRNIAQRHPDADALVFTGDLTNSGDRESYALLREVLAHEAQAPYHLIVGNHDARDHFRATFPEIPCDEHGFVQSAVECEAGVLLLLDTLEEGLTDGVYCERRCAWLQQQLERYAERDVYLFMHHPPFTVGIPDMDACSLREPERFVDVVTSHSNVRHLFFGHLHRPVHGVWRGIPFATQRSTVHQVTLSMRGEPFGLIHEAPMYGILLLEGGNVIVHNHDFLENARRLDFSD